MIENKCSLTRFAVAAASSNENFFFNLCVKSVETAYGRATKDFEWKNQKNMNYLVNVYLKARNGDVVVAAVKRKKGRNRNSAQYIKLLSDVTVKRYFAALLLCLFLHCNY